MKRNKFSLSHYKLLSMDMGELVPIGVTEVLPGDTIQHHTSVLTRLSPMLAPVMHPVKVRVHHWFIPNRIIWEDFESFITGGADGFDASVYPTISMASADSGLPGELGDYLGVPPAIDGLEVSALPFRAYAMLWNEWYRDQDLQDELVFSTESGADTTTNTELQNVGWEKDYFTTSRPWTQKGPEISLPLTGSAPVIGLGSGSQDWTAGPSPDSFETGATGATNYANYRSASDQQTYMSEDPDNPGFPGIFADLGAVSAASINELRLAFALQRYEEARARYGSRYTEYLRHLGVRSSDARLQRPEFLGGGSQTLQFSEVLATAQDNEGAGPDIAVGDLKGHGIGSLRTNRYRRHFEEHGYIISVLSVKPKTMYVQGLPRTWNRRTKEDFWQKELQHIGQQEILQKEIFAETETPSAVFGYQDRYDEYRRSISTIAGEFRTTELDYWHMARIFATEPALNADFIKSVPTKRINAVQENDVLWIMANHSIKARRLLAKSGTSFIL